ncbi:nucleoside phosphorylase [Catenuloplanes nepalensis]|uniref:Nucleoside phosphorylase n=1 Tax=Catenuloplanes nepalensis TaxID=587533 RepID=A0ABT9N0A5_9ACTN|nr:hypothetical protein [Catenuloplanes nepalensis]MDP9797125.1 nucleoside phosphorylase [Catenuloplanes nepalensis]
MISAGGPGFAECRAAAAAVHAAELGPSAERAARPRGALGLFRARGPLAIGLYVAERERRLVWLGPDSFATLEPPIGQGWPIAAGGIRLLLLRVVDRQWELLCFVVPPLSAMALAVPVVFLAGAVPAIVLVLLGVVYIAGCMLGGIVTMTASIVRTVTGRSTPAEVLAPKQWSVRLCHETDPARAGLLLREISERLRELLIQRTEQVSAQVGTQPEDVPVTETAVLLPGGATTTAMRAALLRQRRVSLPFGEDADLVTLEPYDQVPEPPLRTFNTGGFVFWYAGGCAAVILMLARLVAGWERDACGDECAGRPIRYADALHWLVWQLVARDPEGLRPATFSATVLGYLMTVLAVTGILVIGVAVSQGWQALRRLNRRFDDHAGRVGGRTKILLVVAREDEQKATLRVARDRHGLVPEPGTRNGHAVLDLGTLGGADVMLLTAIGGDHSPSSVAVAGREVVRAWRPDLLILVGKCCGLKPDRQRLADIVVCTQARNDDHQEVSADGDGLRLRERAGRADASPEALGAFVTATDGWTGAEVHFGPMVGSGKLHRAARSTDDLRSRHRDAEGADMEVHVLAGVVSGSRTGWAAVRGISDWGDENRNDSNRDAASANAAEFVLHAIAARRLTVPGRPH